MVLDHNTVSKIRESTQCCYCRSTTILRKGTVPQRNYAELSALRAILEATTETASQTERSKVELAKA